MLLGMAWDTALASQRCVGWQSLSWIYPRGRLGDGEPLLLVHATLSSLAASLWALSLSTSLVSWGLVWADVWVVVGCQVCKHLLGAGHTVHVVTQVPEWVFVLDLTDAERALFHHRKVSALLVALHERATWLRNDPVCTYSMAECSEAGEGAGRGRSAGDA
jgi:hypothetical protein